MPSPSAIPAGGSVQQDLSTAYEHHAFYSLGLSVKPPASILSKAALMFALSALTFESHAWPPTGTRLYYNAPIVSERCLVPLSLWEAKDTAALACEDYPASKIFKFNEALAGTRVELSFMGATVTGRWLTDNRNIGNDSVVDIELAGAKFVTRADLGGKIDDGPIRGHVKCGVIYARAKSEGHNPEAGYVNVVIRETPTGIIWRAGSAGRLPGYMPAYEALHLNRDGVVGHKDSRPTPSVDGTCPGKPGHVRPLKH